MTNGKPDDATVLMVGHEEQQDSIESRFPKKKAPSHHLCAGFVLERQTDGAWQCPVAYPGTRKKEAIHA